MKYIQHDDGTIVDNKGNIIFFGFERFVSDICEGNNCFMCGSSEQDTEFNREHIIPRWILRKYELFDQAITLPNGTTYRYDQYTIPCCKECNSYLGKNLEKPIKDTVEGGLSSVNEFIDSGGYQQLFIWLSLIFFKTHLKDIYIRKHQDHRKGNDAIATEYDWGLMHHVYCVARADKAGISIDTNCFGTMMVLAAKESENYHSYDYRDTYAANTMLLRVGEIAFLAVLDDSCASADFFSEQCRKIKGPLSPLQLREILSHLALLNSRLKYRPSYYTWIHPKTNEISISANLPEKKELIPHTAKEWGEILYSNVSELIDAIETTDRDLTPENIKNGMYHFLFDENGDFIKNSMELADA